MKRRGFTLLEIVAVLAVIIIAVAILWPVFARSRNGRPTPHSYCRNNLKQITLGFRQYTQEYDEKYPPVVISNAVGANSFYGWADALQPYLKSTQIYQCPSETHSPAEPAAPTQQGYSDYWYNRNLVGRAEADLANMSHTILTGDGNDGSDVTTARYSISQLPDAWRKDKTSPAYRHYESANYAFADGHVKWLKPDEVTTAPVAEGGYTFAIQ